MILASWLFVRVCNGESPTLTSTRCLVLSQGFEGRWKVEKHGKRKKKGSVGGGKTKMTVCSVGSQDVKDRETEMVNSYLN